MGTYLNPGNSGFSEILQNEYVDKTGLISLINSVISPPPKACMRQQAAKIRKIVCCTD